MTNERNRYAFYYHHDDDASDLTVHSDRTSSSAVPDCMCSRRRRERVFCRGRQRESNLVHVHSIAHERSTSEKGRVPFPA
jgi:hypothetical protein